MNRDLLALRPYPMAELQARKAALREAGIALFDFGTGDPTEPTPPAIAQALRDAVPAISQYPTVAGTPALRQAAADYLQRRFGVSCDPATHILPSAGSKEAIFHLAMALLDPTSDKNTVLYGSPGYPVYQSGALFAGCRAEAVVLRAEDGFRLDLAKLPQETLQRCGLVWLNYPHNPTGACVDLDYYDKQAAICREYDIVLASDECYSDLWFHDQTPPPPSALQAGLEHILVFQSCSKRSGMTGYRSGFIAGDPALIASYRRWRACMGVGSPSFVEAAATEAWNDDAHVAVRRQAFAAKRELLVTGLETRGLRVQPADAGLYLWARLPAGEDADAYATRCLEAGIVISPGGFFGDGGDGFIRLALVPSLSECQQALARWP